MQELMSYAHALRRWSWLIALSTVVAAGAGYWAEAQLPRLYRSTATVTAGEVTQRTNLQATDFAITQSLAQRYALIVGRQSFLAVVRESLAPEMQSGPLQLTATAEPNTSVITMSALDPDPRRAVAIADASARQLLLQSPNPQDEAWEPNRQFVLQQLASLRARIQDGEAQLKELDYRLLTETSARTAQDIQSQSTAIKARLTSWEETYTRLLEESRGGRNNLRILERASPPTLISSIVPANVPVASAIGFVLACVAVLLLESLDDRVRTADQLMRLVSLPVLGMIPRSGASRGPVDNRDSAYEHNSLVGEAYRFLLANLEYCSPNRLSGLLLLVSATPREGTTTVACNLAVALAQAGRQVILADANLRRPHVASRFGLSNQVGLTNLLVDSTMPVDAASLETSIPGLKVLPAGQPAPNAGELLASAQMWERLGEIARLADVVLIDGPAILEIADATILAALARRAVFVVAAGQVRAGQVERAKAMIEQVGTTLSGIVMVNVATNRSSNFEYYSPRAVQSGGTKWGRMFSWRGPRQFEVHGIHGPLDR
jgi:capsular exopolysaccharide synthesis family protein